MHLDQKVSLKTLHTFGMEVEARYFVEAKTLQEVLTLLNYRHMIHMPILFIGRGSNLLFTRDFPGIVIRINSKGISVREEAGEVFVTAEAGEDWDPFVQYCVDRGWAGLENLSLIPGTVGAAPIQNIGAYGVEVKDVIDSVQVAEISSGKQKRLTNAECRFGYRDSIFKQALRDKVIILNVTFRLVPQDPSVLRLGYGNLEGELSQAGVVSPGIADVREAVCNIRRRKLPDPAVISNAGSFFKNPVVTEDQATALLERYPAMPFYPRATGQDRSQKLTGGSSLPGFSDGTTPRGPVKIPAAWLIEQCGWKGFREVDAGVHATQPLVLVNYGNATGSQILGLASRIVDSVREKFGISLETEVNVIG